MKYWRGYLIAAILLACNWALREFARAHSLLVDMVYPYVTRMVQSYLVDWSGGVSFCLWQVLLMAALVIGLAAVVLMVIFKWNPIQWLGWACAIVMLVVFANTCVYGLNEFSGPLAEDVRMEATDYNTAELEQAAIYYRDQANKLSGQLKRDEKGNVIFADFEALAKQASDGFETLVYEESMSVFAGSMKPVKPLGWAEQFTGWGIAGVTVGLTGEAAVNPQAPAVMLPFVMCQQMAKRMSIVVPQDASFAAYLACRSNAYTQFQYSGMLMSYRYCLQTLIRLDGVTGDGAAARVMAGQTAGVTQDLQLCDDFFGDNEPADSNACDLLVSWHIEEIVLPAQLIEQEKFNPLDKNQVGALD